MNLIKKIEKLFEQHLEGGLGDNLTVSDVDRNQLIMGIRVEFEHINHGLKDVVTDENLSHYDVHCPKCRKMNRVSKKQLLRAAPTWKRDREEKSE